MEFITTWSLEKPQEASLLYSRRLQQCYIQSLVTGFNRTVVHKVGSPNEPFDGCNQIIGTLTTQIDETDPPDDFLLIISDKYVVEHCYFTSYNAQGGDFIAADLIKKEE